MKNSHDEIRRLMIAINKMDGLYYLAAKRNGMKGNTLTLLYALDDGEPHSQKQICDEWMIPKTTINTIVKECVGTGYVKLLGKKHSREKTVAITEKGQVYVENMLKDVYDAEKNAMAATLKRFPIDVVSAMECFTENLRSRFETTIFNPADDT